MKFYTYNSIPFYLLILFIFTSTCNRPKVQTEVKSVPVSFKPFYNIGYTEVRRTLPNGLMFDNTGFETEPGYRITFLDKNDSARVYSPDKKAFINFYVFMETDSIFDVARSYFKLKMMCKDSMILQVMDVKEDTLHLLHSLVYMTFYADNYIKSHHLNVEALGRPSARDTLFIKHKISMADKNFDSVFCARQPVQLKSVNPLCIVERAAPNADEINKPDASDFYMNPEFNITINKAYDHFSYSFAVFVDDKGKLYYDHSMIYTEPEFLASTNKTLKGITDGYLTAYLKVTPGSTLGIKHATFIIVNVMGNK